MKRYEVTFTHDEQTLEKLSRMQYDLFCRSNRITRWVMVAALVVLGLYYSEKWWGILLIAYGCYLITSTYSQANYTAHKIAKQLQDANMPFPSSRYEFWDDGMDIFTLPEQERLGDRLAYHQIARIGEDDKYVYVFRDQYGGYMIPKAALNGESQAFRNFIQEQTGQSLRKRVAPVVRVSRNVKEFLDRRNEPWHL